VSWASEELNLGPHAYQASRDSSEVRHIADFHSRRARLRRTSPPSTSEPDGVGWRAEWRAEINPRAQSHSTPCRTTACHRKCRKCASWSHIPARDSCRYHLSSTEWASRSHCLSSLGQTYLARPPQLSLSNFRCDRCCTLRQVLLDFALPKSKYGPAVSGHPRGGCLPSGYVSPEFLKRIFASYALD
jgi:hypothetical protein